MSGEKSEKKSMVDIAYDFIKDSDEAVSFKDIWNDVIDKMGWTEEEAKAKIGIFYTNLSLDHRFHNQGDNTWILRSKLLFDDATADIFLVREDLEEEYMEEDDEDIEDDEESDDYNEDDDMIEDDDDSSDDSLDNDMYESDDE